MHGRGWNGERGKLTAYKQWMKEVCLLFYKDSVCAGSIIDDFLVVSSSCEAQHLVL